jgi:hypothetical protein
VELLAGGYDSESGGFNEKIVMVKSILDGHDMSEAHAKAQRHKGFKIFLSVLAALHEFCLCHISLTITDLTKKYCIIFHRG